MSNNSAKKLKGGQQNVSVVGANQIYTPKRDNGELEPNTPSPGKGDGILKIKETELLTQIKRIVTEVVRTELQSKVEEIQAQVNQNTDDIGKMKNDHDNTVKEVEESLHIELRPQRTVIEVTQKKTKLKIFKHY